MKRVDVLQQAILPDPSLQVIAKQIERRRHTRFPVSISAEVVDTKTQASINGRATDFGVGGCYLDTVNTFPEGTQVEVFLRWEGRTFHCHALVTYAITRGGVGMGLAFTGTAPDQAVSLLDWVRELGGEPWPESSDEAEPDTRSVAKKELTKQPGLKDVVQELLALLIRKHVLTDSEGAQFLGNLFE